MAELVIAGLLTADDRARYIEAGMKAQQGDGKKPEGYDLAIDNMNDYISSLDKEKDVRLITDIRTQFREYLDRVAASDGFIDNNAALEQLRSIVTSLESSSGDSAGIAAEERIPQGPVRAMVHHQITNLQGAVELAAQQKSRAADGALGPVGTTEIGADELLNVHHADSSRIADAVLLNARSAILAEKPNATMADLSEGVIMAFVVDYYNRVGVDVVAGLEAEQRALWLSEDAARGRQLVEKQKARERLGSGITGYSLKDTAGTRLAPERTGQPENLDNIISETLFGPWDNGDGTETYRDVFSLKLHTRGSRVVIGER